jgi:2,3-bisphosphoglycerate-independent phosphoglycerate mutase
MAADRFVLVVLDGLGDRPHPDFHGKSPVEAAATPHLDALVARGTIGSVTVVGPGIAPESDAGVFALLGYDPVCSRRWASGSTSGRGTWRFG